MPKLTPSSQRERRQRILDAAARCFDRQGFHGTTIPDICAEAGVSTGAVYTWFDSKAAIVAAFADEAGQARGALLSQWTTRAELTQGLATVSASFSGSVGPRLDVHLWSAALTDDTLRTLALDAFDQSVTAMGETLRTPPTEDNARGLAGVLLATTIGIEVLSALGSPDTSEIVTEFQQLLAQIGGSDG